MITGDNALKHKKLLIGFLLLLVLLTSFYVTYFITKKETTNNSVVTTEPIVKLPDIKESGQSIIPEKKDTLTEVLISSVGDCTLGTDDKFTYNTFADVVKNNNNNYSYFFKNVRPIFSQDDLTTANLETTLTLSSVKSFKGDPPFYNFKGDPDYAKILTAGSIEAVNLSNNHIHDYLDKGISDTKATLKNNQVNFFGEGTKFITTLKGIKYGFLGYTGFNNDKAFLASVKKDIVSLKADNCIVIINFHWGVEGSYTVNEVQKSIAHFAIDNGADLIIGHHPHVIEGIEQYKGKFICYSLGNFCFGGNQNPGDKDTFIFQIKYKFTNNTLTSTGIKVIPCSISSVSNINDYCPTPLLDDKKTQLLNKLIKLSPNIGLKLNNDDFSYIDVNN
jgi:hypothetical protein